MKLLYPIAYIGMLAAAGCSFKGETASEEQSGLEATESDPTQETKTKDPVLVRMASVKVESIDLKLEATANVESLDMVDVVAERVEPVIDIYVEEGDRVEAGQVLASLRADLAQLALADAEVRCEECRLDVERTERDYERNKNLAEDQATSLISDREVETSEKAHIAAKTAYEAAKVARDLAKIDVERCSLKAPISGTVTARDLSVGDMTTVGARAFEIIDLSSPKAIFYRPQRELSLLRVGQTIAATTEALPDVIIPGRIERISPTVDATSGTVKVTAALDPSGLDLPLGVIPTGVLVSLVLILDTHPNAMLVPKRALLYEGQKIICFVVRDKVAHRIEMKQGFDNAEYMECLAGAGLLPDDQVVIVGADRLSEGDLVEIVQDEQDPGEASATLEVQ